MRAVLTAGAATLCCALAAVAQTPVPSQNELAKCMTAAVTENYAFKRSLFERQMATPPPWPIELLLEERRQQERHCLRVATCIAAAVAENVRPLLHAQQFSSCVEEEVMRQYNARPRS